MRAVNLVPGDARRSRPTGSANVSVGGFGPAYFLVILLGIVVLLILLRVLAGNDVNNDKATLSALRSQVATEQAQAAKLNVYVAFVRSAQEREQDVREIAEQRFAWSRTFDQISHVLPQSTSLSSLSATTSGTAAAATSTVTSTGAAVTGPTFTLAGCADTANQNGVATLLRRLRALSGITDVGFQSSTRQIGCGNSFNLTLDFAAPGSTATSSSTSAVPATTTTSSTTTTTGTTSG